MPLHALPASDLIEPSITPTVLGLFSLNWTVADVTSPTLQRPLYRVQVGLDLSDVPLHTPKMWFRRPPKDPVLSAVQRWGWGSATQQALSSAIAEAWQNNPSTDDTLGQGFDDPSASRLTTVEALEQRLGLATVQSQQRPFPVDEHRSVQLAEVIVNLPATALLGFNQPASTVFYDLDFFNAVKRAADAVVVEMSDVIVQQAGRNALVFAHHHDEATDDDAFVRLKQHANERAGFLQHISQDAKEVREAVAQAFTRPGSTVGLPVVSAKAR